jgi:predicted nucleotidyltransferase
MPLRNRIETSVAIREVLSGFAGVKRTMERETVKEVFRRLGEGGVRYALIGGLACAEYAPPRSTEDVDIVVLAEDVSKVGQLFAGCYRRGTAIVAIYEFEGTRLDVQPAKRKAQAAAVRNARSSSFEGEPVKVVTLRDLLFLKLWSSCEREEVARVLQDQADIAILLDHNRENVTAEHISSIARDLRDMAYTAEEAAKYREAIEWLNGTLVRLGLGPLKESYRWFRDYTRISRTTSPWTSVRRMSRPLKRKVNRLWSTPRRWSMVAWRSWTSTRFSTTR